MTDPSRQTSNSAPTSYRVVGTRAVRHDGADKVTGRALFGADFHIANMLHGKVLRSPHAHARIVSIDVSDAGAMPGVRAVVTADDFPITPPGKTVEVKHWNKGLTLLSHLRGNILAQGKVVYRGQAVAAVAAASPHVAEEAARRIKVVYEVLPFVLSPDEAQARDAPVIHHDLSTLTPIGSVDGPTNVSERLHDEVGDVDRALAESDLVVEREFVTEPVHQGYIEPHNVTALWGPDGRLTVWSSTQGAFAARELLSLILDIPESRVRCVPMEIGGGFGGKFDLHDEPVAALLSRKSGRPVKMVMTREEEFVGAGPAPASWITVKMGATRDGHITAMDAHLVFDAGAFPGCPLAGGARVMSSPYRIPNVRVVGLTVLTNKTSSADYRAPGCPNAAFASEQVIDALAEGLSIDPLEFRALNAATEGTRRPDGLPYSGVGLVEVLQAMQEHPHWSAPLGGPNRGRGVAAAMVTHSAGRSVCTISVNADGTVALVEGSTDIGGTRTTVAMQAAEVLGIDAGDVTPTVAGTDAVGYTHGTGGSRVTFATGIAACNAAEEVKGTMVERAAALWGADAETLEYVAGGVRSVTDSELRISFKDLAARLEETGGPVTGTAAVDVYRGPSGYAAGNIIDVEVDPETGKVIVLRVTVVQDAGKAVHPDFVEGQMQGGTAQGIGWGASEGYFYTDSGRVANSTLLDYRLPTATDLPMIDTVVVEVPNPAHPFGVRGVGEVNIIPPAAALANAVYRASGARVTRLPMSPDTVMAAMGQSGR